MKKTLLLLSFLLGCFSSYAQTMDGGKDSNQKKTLLIDRKIMQEDDLDLIISPEEIAQKVKEMAALLNQDYEGKEVVIVMIMKGAFIFDAFGYLFDRGLRIFCGEAAVYLAGCRDDDKGRFGVLYRLPVISGRG